MNTIKLYHLLPWHIRVFVLNQKNESVFSQLIHDDYANRDVIDQVPDPCPILVFKSSIFHHGIKLLFRGRCIVTECEPLIEQKRLSH